MRFARYFFVCLSGLLLTAGAQAAEAGQVQAPPAQPPATAERPAPALMPGESDGPARPLSIDEAVALALKNNLGLEIQRLNPQIEDELIAQARAPYPPTLQAAFGKSGSTFEPQDFTQGENIVTSSGLTSSFSFLQPSLPWLNTNIQAQIVGGRTTTTQPGARFNPDLSSRLSLQASQPLWRDLLINPVKTRIEQAT